MGDGTTSDQHVSGEAANARPLLFVLTRLWGAVRGFASLKLPTLGRKPATKRTYQQHAPFRTEGFIQLMMRVRGLPSNKPPTTITVRIFLSCGLTVIRTSDHRAGKTRGWPRSIGYDRRLLRCRRPPSYRTR